MLQIAGGVFILRQFLYPLLKNNREIKKVEKRGRKGLTGREKGGIITRPQKTGRLREGSEKSFKKGLDKPGINW